jgi:cytochrome c553
MVGDWIPDEHPPMPTVVVHGRQPHVRGCAMCHMPNGKGRPENGPAAGLSATYIAQQLLDFKHGLRASADPRKTNTTLMIEAAREMTDDEIKDSATYFSSMKWTPWITVPETATGEGKPETFDVLGFTHLCGTTRKTGRFIVKRQTIRKRLSAKLTALKAELRHRWHVPVPQLGQWLRSVVQGWFNYHAVPGNMDRVNVFRSQVPRLWFRALRRRSQRRPMTWARFLTLVGRWLPSAKILHPHPNVRFDATHPR